MTSSRIYVMDTTSSRSWKSFRAITWYVRTKKKVDNMATKKKTLEEDRRRRRQKAWEWMDTVGGARRVIYRRPRRSLCFANHVDRIWFGGAGLFGPISLPFVPWPKGGPTLFEY